MKDQTNIIEHTINKLTALVERALTNLFDGFIIQRPAKKKLRDVPKIHQPFEHTTRRTRK